VERDDGSFNARCPACAELGGDSKGNHLIVFDNSRFACVVNPGDSEEARAHRAAISRLAGDGQRGRKKAAPPVKWRPVSVQLRGRREKLRNP